MNNPQKGDIFYKTTPFEKPDKCHILSAITDVSDKNTPLIITFKYWLNSKKHWEYESCTMKSFEMRFRIKLYYVKEELK
jgi:hypothetical protein